MPSPSVVKHVLTFEGVPSIAVGLFPEARDMRMDSSSVSPAQVLRARDWLKVIRIHTGAIPTQMIEIEA